MLDQRLVDALERGQVDVVKALIAADVDVSAPTEHNVNAMYYALRTVVGMERKPTVELAHLLIEAGADLSRAYAYGETAVFTAAADGHLEILEAMLQHKPRVDVQLDDGTSALHLLADKAADRPLDTSITLTVNGKKHVITDPDAIRQIHGAHPDDEYFRYVRCMALLLEAGAPPDPLNERKQHPLIAAAGAGGPEMLELLIHHGAHVDHADRYGATALQYAVRKGHDDCVQVLLHANANPNTVDGIGYAPIHEAFETDNVNIARMLIAAGANPKTPLGKDDPPLKKGATPAEVAQSKGHSAVLSVLAD